MENFDEKQIFIISFFIIAASFILHYFFVVYARYLTVRKFTKKYNLVYTHQNMIGSILRSRPFDRVYNIFYGELNGQSLFSFVNSGIGTKKIVVNNYVYELDKFEEEKFLNLINGGSGQKFLPKTLVEFAMYTIGLSYISNGKILDLLKMEMIIGRVLNVNTLSIRQCEELYKNVIKLSYTSDIKSIIKDGEGDYESAIISSIEELKKV